MTRKFLPALLCLTLITPHLAFSAENQRYSYLPTADTVKKVAVVVLVVAIIAVPFLGLPFSLACAQSRPVEFDPLQEAIESFARAHGQDLEQLLKSKPLTEELLKTPEVSDFLARMDAPPFIEQQVVVEEIDYKRVQTNAAFTDSEKTIYAALCHHKITIPFRSSEPHVTLCSDMMCTIKRPSCQYAPSFFYNSGTEDVVYEWLLERVLSEIKLPKGISADKGRDIYQMGTSTKKALEEKERHVFKDSGLEYIVYPGHKDGHAFTVLSVIDRKNGKVRGHLLFNTWQKTEYFDYLNYRIDMFTTREDGYQKPPFVDASLQVQTAHDDANCALYTSILTRGLLALLCGNREFVVDLASVFEPTTSESQETVVRRIRYTLESRLPFFDCDEGSCTRKSDEEIRRFFLDYRWKIGSEYLTQKLLPSLEGNINASE